MVGSQSPGVALGKNTKLSSPERIGLNESRQVLGRDGQRAWTPEEAEEARRISRKRRFDMQTGAVKLLPDTRVCMCLRWMQSKIVEVYHKPLTSSARFAGLQVCGSVWMCPVCAAKITEHRRQELSAAVKSWYDKGGEIVFVTYTERHKAGQSLKSLVDGLTAARNKTLSGKAAQSFRTRFNVIGQVRSLEVTYGGNGWHPHFHELMFVEPGIDIDSFKADLSKKWGAALKSSGMSCNEHGLDVKMTRDDVSQYITKFGREQSWGIESEITKWPVKSGSGNSITPMDMLSEYRFEGDMNMGELFIEYARTMKGKNQLVWSRGLKAYLIPDFDDKSDEEIAKDVDMCEVLMASLNTREWNRVLTKDLRAEILNVASTGNLSLLKKLLDDNKIIAMYYVKPEINEGIMQSSVMPTG